MPFHFRQALTALSLSITALHSQAVVLQGWADTSSAGRFSAVPELVPEPTSMALVLYGLFGMAALERRRVHDWLWLRLKAGLRHSLGWFSRPASS